MASIADGSALAGLLVGLFTSFQISAVGPALEVDEAEVEHADVYQHERVRHAFRARNTSSETLEIQGLVAEQPGARFVAEPATLGPGEAGRLVVEVPVGDSLGRMRWRFRFASSLAPGEKVLTLSTFVRSAYDPERPRFALGTIESGHSGRGELDLFSREVESLEILEILELPPFVDVVTVRRVGLAKEGVRLRATLGPGAPKGAWADSVLLKTNVPNQPLVRIYFGVRP